MICLLSAYAVLKHLPRNCWKVTSMILHNACQFGDRSPVRMLLCGNGVIFFLLVVDNSSVLCCFFGT